MTQKACGIICEYNPFHNGHKYQIEYVKSTLGLPVVCVMSGDFVQRGNAACADKSARAKSAVEGGADIVLELPFPFSSMTAERFANAGISILDRSGMCSHVAFGSECADIEKLSKIAELLLDVNTKKSIQVYQKENPDASYAVARTRVISERLGEEYAEISSKPNDILAIEYVKAIKRQGSELVPIAVRRTVDRAESSKGDFASSSHIRRLFCDGMHDEARRFLPNGEALGCFNDDRAFYELIRLFLTTRTPESLADVCEISGGLEYAVVRSAREAKSYAELCKRLSGKTLTDAKIRRMLLFAFFGVPKSANEEIPEYTSVLAMGGENARELMRVCRKEKRMIVAQRTATVRADKTARRQLDFAENARRTLIQARSFAFLAKDDRA